MKARDLKLTQDQAHQVQVMMLVDQGLINAFPGNLKTLPPQYVDHLRNRINHLIMKSSTDLLPQAYSDMDLGIQMNLVTILKHYVRTDACVLMMNINE